MGGKNNLIVVFKPLKGSWHQAILSSVELDNGRFYFKVDKSDSKEQLHFNMSDVEAYALTRDLSTALSGTNFFLMLQNHIKSQRRNLK